MDKVREGWWMPARGMKHHYFVDGRALCGGWIFPNYDEMTGDTGEGKPHKDDCIRCFRKLLKRERKNNDI